jgi:hypothetical protein
MSNDIILSSKVQIVVWKFFGEVRNEDAMHVEKSSQLIVLP